MAMPVREGTQLWEPSEAFKEATTFTRYLRWLADERGKRFAEYDALWQWSVDDLEGFWASIWDFCGVRASKPYTAALADRAMPGARWFAGAELSYAENVFAQAADDRPALLFQSERVPLMEMSWAELRARVAAVAAALRAMGVERGDRVVAYMPNIP